MEKTLTLPTNIKLIGSDTKTLKLELGKYNQVKKMDSVGAFRISLPKCNYSSVGNFNNSFPSRYKKQVGLNGYDDYYLDFIISDDFICLSQYQLVLKIMSELASRWETLEDIKKEIRGYETKVSKYHYNIYSAITRIIGTSTSFKEVRKILSITKKLVISKK